MKAVEVRPLDPSVRATARLLDLGCGSGASLESAVRRFGVPGVGLDRSARKVRAGQEAGRPVFRADVLALDPEAWPKVRYAVFDNVLEHLDGLEQVHQALARACATARRLVHIRHPSFEHVDYLASMGLKQYWTDWPGVHTCPVRLHQFVEMAADLGVYRVVVVPVLRATDASDPSLLPVDAPPGQRKLDRSRPGAYDADLHGPKPDVTFDRPVYYAFDLFLVTGGTVPEIHYRHPTDRSAGRPEIVWPGRTRRERFGRARRRWMARARARR